MQRYCTALQERSGNEHQENCLPHQMVFGHVGFVDALLTLNDFICDSRSPDFSKTSNELWFVVERFWSELIPPSFHKRQVVVCPRASLCDLTYWQECSIRIKMLHQLFHFLLWQVWSDVVEYTEALIVIWMHRIGQKKVLQIQSFN